MGRQMSTLVDPGTKVAILADQVIPSQKSHGKTVAVVLDGDVFASSSQVVHRILFTMPMGPNKHES